MTFPGRPRRTPRSRSKRKKNERSTHTFDSHDEKKGLIIMSIIACVAVAIAIQALGGN